MNDTKINKLMKESLTGDIKVFPKCESREHRLIWASIGLLFLGQLFSFVYIYKFHGPLLCKSSAGMMMKSHFDDDENLPSLPESPSVDYTIWTDKHIHERRKRSSDPKPNRKRSPKVSRHVKFKKLIWTKLII